MNTSKPSVNLNLTLLPFNAISIKSGDTTVPAQKQKQIQTDTLEYHAPSTTKPSDTEIPLAGIVLYSVSKILDAE